MSSTHFNCFNLCQNRKQNELCNNVLHLIATNWQCLPVYTAHLGKPVSQVFDKRVDGYIDPEHFALSTGTPVDDGDIDGAVLSLWEGQGDADVGVKGARACITGGTDDGRAELALEEILDEGVVALHVTDEGFCGHVFIRSTCAVL